MDERTLEILEFPKIKGLLARHTSFSASRELALHLHPSTDLVLIERWQRLTGEARYILNLQTDLPIGEARDVREHIRRASLSGVLTPAELLDILATLRSSRRVRMTISRLSLRCPTLAALAALLTDCPALEGEISRSIGEKGEVLDEATPLLRQIRAELRIAHEQVIQRLNQLLHSPSYQQVIQEPIITSRDGRYVIPIKTDFKGRLKGIVHDQSSSGLTLFVEPLSVVDLNNRCRELYLEEQREIERVLRRLSEHVAAHSPALEGNVEALAEIDLALAKAEYSVEIGGVEPKFIPGEAKDSRIACQLSNARHPLLTGTVIPITVRLGGDFNVLVITGPNTGGKTVALKTVGLLAIMAQAGMHIPVDEGSQLRIFNHIFADIGDEQSIEQSLSTFSSHMTHIIAILQQCDSNSLVLLDEIGAGTDPAEGSALARAILSYLLKCGSFTIATTHYSELKSFAHVTPGVENACVEFDLETLAPTYHLTIGLPGRSNALAIAMRLGLAQGVIEAARSFVNPSEAQVESLLAEIQGEHHMAKAETEAARTALREAERLRQDLLAQLACLEEERTRIIDQARSEAMAEIQEVRAHLRLILSSAEHPSRQEASLALEEAKRLQKGLESRPQPKVMEQTEGAKAWQKGDRVRVRNLGRIGELVSEIDDEGKVTVRLGSFHLRVLPSDLERAAAMSEMVDSHPLTKRLIIETKREAPSPKLDLRRWHIDQAKAELEKYLNDAFVAGLPLIRIIHGKGTGALRQAVRGQLTGHPLVKDFTSASPREGGDGVTIVTLADY